MDNTTEEEILHQFGGLEANDLTTLVNSEDIAENEPQLLRASTYTDLETIEESSLLS